jgi:hypothetical protein
LSGYTQTQAECLYSYGGASTNLATFTTEDNLLKTYPLCQIPGSIFGLGAGTGALSKTLRIRAGGQAGSTATPTFTFSLRVFSANPAFSAGGGVLLGSSSVMTAGSTVTLAPWILDVDVTLRTAPVTNGTATVVTMGSISGGIAFPVTGTIPGSNVAPTVATWSVDTVYYLYLSAACGTSNALNLINTQYLKVYGDN